MFRAPRRLSPALLLAAPLMTACAGGPSAGPGPMPPIAPPIAPLFVSPFGEPFQGREGDAWPSAAWFAGADADGDGALTFAEFEADGGRWFATLDLNGDGRLNPAELTAHEAALDALRGPGIGPANGPGGNRPGRPGGREGAGPVAHVAQSGPPPGGGRDGARGRGGPGGSRGYGRIAEAGWFNLPQPVRAFDANLNQTVTAEEWADRTNRLFLTLDADRDGRLTLDALPRTPLQQAATRA